MCARVAFLVDGSSIPVALRGSGISGNQGTIASRDFRLSLGQGNGARQGGRAQRLPGPAHVLELARRLHLTADQKVKTEALFKRMQARAISLGKELVEEERVLNNIFALQSVTPEALGSSLARIVKLQGQVRQVHLEAHLEQTALLSPEQVRQYNRIRGYGATAENDNHEQRRH